MVELIFTFSFGDTLRYIGYSETITGTRGSDIIEDIPGSHEMYLFNITNGIPCNGTPTVTYEGQVYNTVQIFGQCWLKEI